MARFGRDFVRAATQPAYLGGLFEAFRGVGQLPANARRSRMLSDLDISTPEGLTQLSSFYKAQGKIPEAVQTAGAARRLAQENATTKALEGLRDNIIERAQKLPGFENLADTAANASPQQLEQMRQAILAEETRLQQKRELIDTSKAAAANLGISADMIEVFADDGEGLQALVQNVAESKAANALEQAGEKATAKALANRAISYNAPQELIQDIKEGFYNDKPLEALAAMRGEDSKNESYQNAETGEVFMLATKGAKVFKDGKWALPSELGLIAAPKVTAEGSVPKFRAENRSTTFLGFAAGATDRFINELDTFGNLQGDVLLSGVSPITTNATEALDSYRAFTREALLRFTSGAAVPEAEVKRYTDMVNITSKDLFSPKAMVHKIIAAAALTSINAKQTSGEISASEARVLALEAGSMTLTDEDYDLLRSDRPGSMKKVVKKYTDPLLGNDVSTTLGTVDSILSKYNF